MSFLIDYKENLVRIITTDGRFFIGTLSTYDLSTNIVLSDTKEIILGDIEGKDATQIIPLGVYFIRGDTVVLCGDCSEDIDWTEMKSKPLKTTKHAT